MSRVTWLGYNAERFPLGDTLRLVDERPHFNLALFPFLSITLIDRLNAVKTNPILVTAHQAVSVGLNYDLLWATSIGNSVGGFSAWL